MSRNVCVIDEVTLAGFAGGIFPVLPYVRRSTTTIINSMLGQSRVERAPQQTNVLYYDRK